MKDTSKILTLTTGLMLFGTTDVNGADNMQQKSGGSHAGSYVKGVVDGALAAGGHRTTTDWVLQTVHRSVGEWFSQGNHRSIGEWFRGVPSKNKK